MENKVCTFAKTKSFITYLSLMKETAASKTLNLKSLTKSTVWDVQENDVFRMLEAAEKDAEFKDNLRHFADIIRSAFMIEEIKDDNKLLREKYTKMGYKVGSVRMSEDSKAVWKNLQVLLLICVRIVQEYQMNLLKVLLVLLKIILARIILVM